MPRLTAETLAIKGPDATDFAHAQLTSDVHSLLAGSWQWSAWLSPQGRVRFVLQVIRKDAEHLLLLLRGGKADDLAEQIRPFVMRRRAVITAHAPRLLEDAAALPLHEVQMADSSIRLGMGDHALHVGASSVHHSDHADTPQHWRSAAIRAGQVWLPENTLDKLLTPSLALLRLGAISLQKGCFPGQEIVARLHHRGGAKQHLYLIQGPPDLLPGSILHVQGKNVGYVLDGTLTPDRHVMALAAIRDTLSPSTTLIEDQLGPIKVMQDNATF